MADNQCLVCLDDPKVKPYCPDCKSNPTPTPQQSGDASLQIHRLDRLTAILDKFNEAVATASLETIGEREWQARYENIRWETMRAIQDSVVTDAANAAIDQAKREQLLQSLEEQIAGILDGYFRHTLKVDLDEDIPAAASDIAALANAQTVAALEEFKRRLELLYADFDYGWVIVALDQEIKRIKEGENK